jgi:hypothetical protein
MNSNFNMTSLNNGFTSEMTLAMTKGIDLNTEAHVASSQGDHTKALTLYQEAVDIKVKAYGEIVIMFALVYRV